MLRQAIRAACSRCHANLAGPGLHLRAGKTGLPLRHHHGLPGIGIRSRSREEQDKGSFILHKEIRTQAPSSGNPLEALVPRVLLLSFCKVGDSKGSWKLYAESPKGPLHSPDAAPLCFHLKGFVFYRMFSTILPSLSIRQPVQPAGLVPTSLKVE
jgi:hypothetical protein